MKPFNFTKYILNNPLLMEAEQQDVQLLFKIKGADKPMPIDFEASFEADSANKPGGVEFYNIKLVPKGANAKYLDTDQDYSMEYNKTKDIFSFQTPVFIQDSAQLYQTTPSFTDWLAGNIDSVNTGEGSDMKGKSKYNGQTIANTVATMMQKGAVK